MINYTCGFPAVWCQNVCCEKAWGLKEWIYLIKRFDHITWSCPCWSCPSAGEHHVTWSKAPQQLLLFLFPFFLSPSWTFHPCWLNSWSSKFIIVLGRSSYTIFIRRFRLPIQHELFPWTTQKNVYNSMTIWQTQFADEDILIWWITPELQLNGPCHEIVFSTLFMVFFCFSVVSRAMWLMRLRQSRSSMMPQLCLSPREVTRHTSRCEVLSLSTGPRTFPPWCQNLQYDVRLILLCTSTASLLSRIRIICLRYQQQHHVLHCILS